MRKFLIVGVLSLATTLPFAVTAAPTKATTSKPAAAANFTRSATLPKWAQPLAAIAPTTHEDAVVVRLSETQAWAGPSPAVLENLAVQVNAKSALESIGQFGITFLPAYQKLVLHRVALLRGKEVLDRTASVNTRLLEREPGLENGIYGGAMTLQLLLEDVQVGDTLWLTYTVEGANPVFGNRWSDTFSWDSGSRVEERKLTVLHPKNRPLKWRTLGDFKAGEIKPVIDQLGATERLVFSEKGMDALDYEPSTPNDYVSHRRLQFSEFDNWQEVATWAGSMFPLAPSGPATMALKARFAQQGDAMAQATAALHWVQDEIRYFSVSMGENSHRPQSPDVVLKRRYGDCKDKSYLLVSLLRDLGIQARPVLVNSMAYKMPGKGLATPLAFDHVIVQIDIDGKRYNVDPTRSGERGLLSVLPPAIPAGSGLLVHAISPELVTLADSTPTEALMERFETIRVASFDGDATLEVRRVYRRGLASMARQSIPALSAAELRKFALGQYEKQYPGITVVDKPTHQDSADGNSFEMLMKFKLVKPVNQVDGQYRIEFDAKLVDDTLGIPDNLVRNFPFAFPLGRIHSRYHLDVHWPQTVRSHTVQAPTAADSPFFKLKEEYTLRGNLFRYNADYKVKQESIPAAQLPELQKAVKTLLGKTLGIAQVGPSDFVKEAGSGLTMRNVEILRMGLAFEEFNQLSQKKKLKDIGIDNACDVLINAYALGAFLPDSGKVLPTLDATLAAQASVPGFNLCRARFKFSRGDFAASVPLFKAGGVTADGDPNTLLLAWARMHDGTDVAAAQRDILRYYDDRKRQGLLSGYDMAATVALLQRMKAPIPVELTSRRDLATGAWPLPIVAMQLGSLSVEALLDKLKVMEDDERELAANEANFYIAQTYIAQGKKQLAIDALQWFRVNGMRSTELGQHALAELWLQHNDDPDLKAASEAASKDDFPAALQLYGKAAARGVPLAQYALGLFHYDGRGTRENAQEAAKWMLLAAGNNVPGAMNYLAIMYANGKGVEMDMVRAVKWLEAGASLGEQYASANLGARYMEGHEYTPQDFGKAYRLLSRGAEMGEVKAQANLSYLYTEGKGTEKDYTAASYWARLSLMRGEPEGMLRMGILARGGLGMDKDAAMALKLFDICFKMKSGDCAYQLGLMYEAGDGVQRDAGRAQRYFESGAEYDSVEAQLRVAHEKLAKDPESTAALDLLLRAAFMGSEAAVDLIEAKATRSLDKKPNLELIQLLGVIRRHASGTVFSYEKAARWLIKGSELGSSQAMNNLGDLYEKGAGVEKNVDKAIELFKRAATNGNGPAFYSLGTLYDAGVEVPPNPRLAYLYLELAMRRGLTRALPSRNRIRATLSKADREAADVLAAGWRPEMALPVL